MDTIFKDLKVIELASVLAGPLVGSFLSELGANVIKIENKTTGGDITRQWKNSQEDPSATLSSYYHSANFNKESILLDFNDKEDLTYLFNLLEDADIVISNYQKRVSSKFGVDPYTITKQFPEIIFVQLDAYEYDDPRPGFDMVMQAETGFISMCGTPDGELVKMPVAMIDILASHQMKEALLIGLLKKSKTGKGSIAFVSLFQSALTALVNQGTNFLNEGIVAQPLGTLHPNIAPYGDMVYSKEGKPIMLAIGSDSQFATLFDGLEISLEEFDQFKFNYQRISNRDKLMVVLNKYTKSIGYQNLTALFTSKGLPYGEVKSLDEVMNDKSIDKMVVINSHGARSFKHAAFDIVVNN